MSDEFCKRCQLGLDAGASHVMPQNCIDALRSALDDALSCANPDCENDTSDLCTGCAVKDAGAQKLKEVAARGASALFQKIMESAQGPPPKKRPRRSDP